jgi:hypothetical protein
MPDKAPATTDLRNARSRMRGGEGIDRVVPNYIVGWIDRIDPIDMIDNKVNTVNEVKINVTRGASGALDQRRARESCRLVLD